MDRDMLWSLLGGTLSQPGDPVFADLLNDNIRTLEGLHGITSIGYDQKSGIGLQISVSHQAQRLSVDCGACVTFRLPDI